MPKMKTKSGAKKRLRVRPGGTVKRGQAYKRHILTKKSTKNKRHLRGPTGVHAKGGNTRNRKKHSTKLIIRRRVSKRYGQKK